MLPNPKKKKKGNIGTIVFFLLFHLLWYLLNGFAQVYSGWDERASALSEQVAPAT